MRPRIFSIDSFDDTTGSGLARDIQTNTSFIFDRAGLADDMDGVAFVGECVTADVEGNRLLAGINMADIISIGNTNQLGIGEIQGGVYPTDGNGRWPDTYWVCSPACPSAGLTTAVQQWTYNLIPLLHYNSLVYKCTSITIDGF